MELITFFVIGKNKNYSLVFSNNNGNNLFFVKKELLNNIINQKPAEEIYVKSKFREYLNDNSRNDYIDDNKILEFILKDSSVIEV